MGLTPPPPFEQCKKKLQIWKRGTPLKALDDCFVKADWEQETMRRQLTSIKLIAELWFNQKATKNTTTLPKKEVVQVCLEVVKFGC